MTQADTHFCPSCGERVSARARFCSACGARQDEFRVPQESSGLWSAGGPATTPPVEEPPTPPPPPPAGEPSPPPPLADVLRERLALPGVIAAAIAGSVSAGIVLAAGLLIAVIAPDDSIVGIVGTDAGLFREAFRQGVGTLLAPMVDPGLIIAGSRRLHPALLLAIPLTALALTTRRQLHRTEGAPPLVRAGWATLVAVPFAFWMLIFAAVGGATDSTNISAPPGNAFALGLLWGVLGGLIGAATALPLTLKLPAAARAALATLRPLAIVLAVCTLIGLVGWLVQVARDVGGVRADRSPVTALVEEAAFGVEHGVNLTALVAAARFRADANGALGLPFPVEDANAVPGRDGAFRVYSYDGLIPVFAIVAGLLLALAALYAGFAAARAMKSGSLAAGAGWGALTGPAWAVTMAALVVLAGGLFHGDADDASVFGIFLLGGGLLGACGGALAAGDQPPGGTPDSSS